MEKKRMAGLLTCIALTAGSVIMGCMPSASADSDITIYVNGARLAEEDVEPQIIGKGTTMVPFRFIFEALNMNVDYQTAPGGMMRVWAINREKNVRIDLYTSDTTLYYSNLELFNSSTSKNRVLDVSTKISMPEAPFIDGNSRTLVPLRAISESLGAKVEWEQPTKSIYIEYDGVEDYRDVSSGTYYYTDFRTFYTVTGVKSKRVDFRDDSIVYDYGADASVMEKYFNALKSDGYKVLYQDDYECILEDEEVRYIDIYSQTDGTIRVMVWNFPSFYLTDTDFYLNDENYYGAPNYGYYAERECISHVIGESGAHIYRYNYKPAELEIYKNRLLKEGFELYSDEGSSVFYTNGVLLVGINASDETGSVLVLVGTITGSGKDTSVSMAAGLADNRKGDYPDTDIPTYYSVTGVASSSAERDGYVSSYSYPYKSGALAEYLNYLKSKDIQFVYYSKEESYVFCESSHNKYIQITEKSDGVDITVYWNPDIYISGTSESVPNYTYCTDRECFYWDINEDDDRMYYYEYSSSEVSDYIKQLTGNGFKRTETGDSDGVSYSVYEKGDTYVGVLYNEDTVIIVVGEAEESNGS